MYWYFKYPLYAVLGLVLFGLVFLGWTRLPEGVRDALLFRNDSEAVAEPGTAAAPAGGVPAPAAADPPPATLDPETLRCLDTAEAQLREDNLVAARALALKVVDQDGVVAFDVNWRRAVDVISKVNTVLVNTDAPAPEKAVYVIKTGDNLVRIAHEHRTSVGALQRFNGLKPTQSVIYPGNPLYIYQADWAIEVYKSKFVLLLKDGDKPFKLYRVGIGRQNRTPVGVFEVSSKVREPAWTAPGKHIPYGHKENVLGTHWLGLKPVGDTAVTLKGYGIHGTWAPETIGTAASQGCVRMLNQDVAELYDLVPSGTRVVIGDD